jgi:hypothetical protein
MKALTMKALTKSPRQRKKPCKRLHFLEQETLKKKKKKYFPFYYSTYKNKSQALLKKDL